MCDVPASTCTEWASHCKATHASAHWREQRQYKKAGGSNAGGSGGSIFENSFSGMVQDERLGKLAWDYSMEAVKDFL